MDITPRVEAVVQAFFAADHPSGVCVLIAGGPDADWRTDVEGVPDWGAGGEVARPPRIARFQSITHNRSVAIIANVAAIQGRHAPPRRCRIRAVVWLNETDSGLRYNVQISRLFKDKDDKWKDATSFGRGELSLLGKVDDQSMVWNYENPAGSPASRGCN